MQSNFDRSLALVLREEGGWADHPADPGGATMKGITFAVFKAYCRQKKRKVPTKTDLRNISDADVAAIYRLQYWNAVAGDEMPAGLDFALFDFAVNSGSGQAVKDFQRVLNANVSQTINADGKITLVTKEEAKRQYKEAPERLINAYMDRRLVFLKKLKGWSTFGRGWSNRVARVRKDALAMAKRKVVEAPTPVDYEVEASPKAPASNVAVERTGTGKSVAVTVAGAAGTAVAASADRVLDASTYAGGSALLIGIVAFVILTVIGGIATAYYLKRKAADENTI